MLDILFGLIADNWDTIVETLIGGAAVAGAAYLITKLDWSSINNWFVKKVKDLRLAISNLLGFTQFPIPYDEIKNRLRRGDVIPVHIGIFDRVDEKVVSVEKIEVKSIEDSILEAHRNGNVALYEIKA